MNCLFVVSDRCLCGECCRSREKKMKSREVLGLVLFLHVFLLAAVSSFLSIFHHDCSIFMECDYTFVGLCGFFFLGLV